MRSVLLCLLVFGMCVAVSAQDKKGTCYDRCNSDYDCGFQYAPDCKYCIHGVCSCAPPLKPCNTDEYVGSWTPYACMNTSTQYCSSNAGPQPLSTACFDTPNLCPAGYACQNTITSYECDDIDECASGKCGPGYECTNTPGSYSCRDLCGSNCAATGGKCSLVSGAPTCACSSGYSNTGFQCDDINECLKTTACATGVLCVNTPGSFACNGSRQYFIKNPESGLVLTGGTAKGASVTMSTRKTENFNDQLWSYIPGQGSFLKNLLTGYVMDIKNGQAFVGAEVITWDLKNTGWSSNQQWRYNASDLTFTSMAGDYVADIKSASTASGTPLLIWYRKPTSQNSNQRFAFEEYTA